MPASSTSDTVVATGVRQAAGVLRLPDGSELGLHLRLLDPCGDRAEILAVDAEAATVGAAGYTRVYGPRAELAVDVAERWWPSCVPEILVAKLCDVAAGYGIAAFLVRVSRPDVQLAALLRMRFGAREMRGSEFDDLRIATAAAARPGLGPEPGHARCACVVAADALP